MKKIVIVVIVMVIAIGLFGCSSPGSGNTPSKPTKLSISLSENSATLAASGTLKLTATESGGTVPIIWSSQNNSIATVNQEGVVDANGPGTTNIVATIQGTNVTATCSVVVTGVAQITLSQNDISSFVSLTPVLLTATTVKPGVVTWATDNSTVATVNSAGLVTFVSAGTAIITAIQAITGATATCVVTVTQATLSLNAATLAGFPSLPPSQLTATASDPGLVTWSSSNTAVATVNSTGLVTFVSAGTTTITATQASTNLKATCVVTVTQATLSLNAATLAGYTNQSATLTATATSPGALTWTSVTPTVATVDSTGKVTFVGAGVATIKVAQQSTNLSALCTVTVTQPTLSLQYTNIVAYTGQKYISDLATFPTQQTGAITWSSSNTGVATVTGNTIGSFVFNSTGTTIITATQTSTGAKATCTITVVPNEIITTSNDATQLTAPTGYKGALTFISNVTFATISLSSNPAFVTVSSQSTTENSTTFLVSFNSGGIGNIVVYDSNDSKNTCTFGITSQSLTLNKTNLVLLSTDPPVQLTATTIPANLAVTWSSTNSKCVTVSNTGLVTRISNIDNAQIIASVLNGQVKGFCNVTTN
ncbi:MAG: Ig-like domain-containing protein [Fusobacteria bacterium]|nr:Ig-like domain-containing protein [Fusobacteriota bacterium]